ncbi:TolB-like translocation protein [Streptomyces sp. NPDC048255]|uniref:TolB family protein n=1 Tax=Streptomyces sp. NPDC048255 TaxID=3154713 RepID=UPI0033F4EA44
MTHSLRKVLLLVLFSALLAATAVVSVVRAADRAGDREEARPGGPRARSGEVSLEQPGRLLFRNLAWGPGRDMIASVPLAAPADARTTAPQDCLRFHAAAGTGVCLRRAGGVVPSYEALVLDSALRPVRSFEVPGTPTRARVSPSGKLLAWTVFVSGDSYAGGSFSTRTALYDTRSGVLVPSLEDFAVLDGGKRRQAADHNFWGVTFAADDNRFYATLATGGRTHLVEGDLRARELRVLRENVECPSLSPDGARIAFKKRVTGLPDDAPWRLYVLDLATGAETGLAEQRSVDDQALWYDDGTLLYSLPGDFGGDLWSLPATGAGSPRLLVPSAVSPAVLPS